MGQRQVAALLARSRVAVALAVGSRRALNLAVAVAVVAVALRLFGVPFPPVATAWSAAVVVVVALAAALSACRHSPVSAQTASVILDRRQQLGGLLVCEATATPLGSAWRRVLTDRMVTPRSATASAPRIVLTSFLLRFAGAAALLASLTLLEPPPSPDGTPTPRSSLTAAAERTTRAIELAVEDRALHAEQAAELSKRGETLEQRLKAGDSVAWSDVDSLHQQLMQEQQTHKAKLRSVAERGLEYGSRETGDESGTGATQPATRAATQLAMDAVELGLLDRLPADLAQQLREQLMSADSGANTVPVGLPEAGNQALPRAGITPEQLELLLSQRFDPELMDALAQTACDGALGELDRLHGRGRLSEYESREPRRSHGVPPERGSSGIAFADVRR